MTDSPAVTPPLHSVTPHLICRGASEAIAFYEKAFGAVEISRMPAPDGRLMHASIILNGSSVMLVDEAPELGNLSPLGLGGTPVTLHLIVDDAQAVAAQAIAAGADEILPVSRQFWGDLYGVVQDPFGHRWAIATPDPSFQADPARPAGADTGTPGTPGAPGTPAAAGAADA